MKTSKITTIQGSGTFDSQHGLLYKFEYGFEDGATLTANHKSQESPFKVGDEAEYNIKGSNNFGSWGQVKKPDQGEYKKPSSGGQFKADPLKQASIEKQVALKEAINFHNVAGFHAATPDVMKADVLMTAKYFYEEFLKG